ncbi:MAG: urea transporter [Verrucomicrobiaceae bacterium]|nr:urea transporter [Verrucomicrobiaceae bacterium]
MKTLLDHVLRGFGQMFVCNNRGTGLCVLIGLFLLSPQSAMLALLGASVISWAARRLAKNAEVLKTGLFSVNGALLGAVWMAFPQMPLWAQITATVLGAVLMAKVFVPVAERMHQKRSPYVLFSLPYVAAAWVAILTLIAAGVHDAELTRGWRALPANELDKAERHFLHTEVHTDEAEASRCAGLGWSLFRRGDQIGAQQAFSRVLTLETGVADAYDGLGWSRFRENRLEDAEMAFRRAVALDGFFADSWDGLGWCALAEQKPAEARRHFTMAVLCAPLFADAWQGLALTFPSPNLSPGEPLTSYRESPAGERDQKPVSLSPANDSQSQLKPTSGERVGVRGQAIAVSRFLSRQLSLSAQLTSSRVLLCWLWFFIGILWHSRTSAAMALVGVSMCLIGSKWLPGFGDASLAMNLVAMLVALGGHYLRLNLRSMVWMLLLACAMAWAHPWLSDQLLKTGLLPLCLPFNTALLLSLAVMRRDRVPIEWAACSPAEIRVFFAQKEVAEACWAKLRKSDAEKSSVHRPAACSSWRPTHDFRPTTRNA